MTNPITTLTCPSCGSRLSIVKGVDRFACGHCGNEHIVKRESGIVYLEPIAEDIRHIRSGVDNLRGGVDRTAAELAIPRLTKEIAELEGKLEAARTSAQETVHISPSTDIRPRSKREITLMVLSFLLFLIGLVAVQQYPIMLCVSFIFAILCLFAFALESQKLNVRTRKMKQEAAKMKQETIIKERQDTLKALETQVNDKKAALERTRKLLD